MNTDHGIKKEAIPLYPSGELTKSWFIEIQYTIFGSSFKIQLLIFKGGTAEEFLHFLNEYNNTKGKLGYTSYQKLESGIEQLLQGTAKVEWNIIKETIQTGTNTLQSFEAWFEAFSKIYIPEPAAMHWQS